MIRVLVVHRDLATGQAIASGMAAEDVESVGSARGREEMIEFLDQPGAKVDIVIATAATGSAEALELAESLRGRDPRPKLVVTGLPSSDAVLIRYMEAGADAYLTEDHSLAGLLLIVRLLARGETLVGPSTAHLLVKRIQGLSALLAPSGIDLSAISDLTERESEVLALLGANLTNQQIAKRLFIEVGTVKSHVHSILSKLDVRDRAEARKVFILSRSESDDGENPAIRRDRPR